MESQVIPFGPPSGTSSYSYAHKYNGGSDYNISNDYTSSFSNNNIGGRSYDEQNPFKRQSLFGGGGMNRGGYSYNPEPVSNYGDSYQYNQYSYKNI